MSTSGASTERVTVSSGHLGSDTVIPPGLHALVDAEGCDSGMLDDAAAVRAAVLDAIESSGVKLLHLHVASFDPCGVTAVAVLAESHVSVHTWPELGYAAIDAFTCGEKDPKALCLQVASALGATSTATRCHLRGKRGGGS